MLNCCESQTGDKQRSFWSACSGISDSAIGFLRLEATTSWLITPKSYEWLILGTFLRKGVFRVKTMATTLCVYKLRSVPHDAGNS